MTIEQQAIEFFLQENVLKFGDFTLKSGRKSPYFFNTGSLCTAAQLSMLGELYARKLEAEGVRAITGNCGFMVAYQDYVAARVNVPVFLTSLVQLPMLLQMIGHDRVLGILTANSAALGATEFARVGITDTSRIRVRGMELYPHFNDVVLKELGTLDEELMTAEVVAAAQDLLAENPSLGAFMLECSDLPPYSKAIHEATGLPVFDWANFITYVHHATVPHDYHGIT